MEGHYDLASSAYPEAKIIVSGGNYRGVSSRIATHTLTFVYARQFLPQRHH